MAGRMPLDVLRSIFAALEARKAGSSALDMATKSVDLNGHKIGARGQSTNLPLPV